MNLASHTTEVATTQPPIEAKHEISDRLYISNTLLAELRAYGHTSPNREVCGLVTGDSRKWETSWCAKKFQQITNISEGKYGYDDYVMDQDESMAVLKDTSLFQGESLVDLVAIFHTHPHSTPYPSSIDIKHAAYNVIYIIYSLTYDEFTFNLWDGTWFRPVKVEVIE